MSDPPDRIYIRGGVPLIDMFRAMRSWIEQQAAKEGKTLDPAWYRDSPEEAPELYPELKKQQSPDASRPEGDTT
jgi:hypothetical protein